MRMITPRGDIPDKFGRYDFGMGGGDGPPRGDVAVVG